MIESYNKKDLEQKIDQYINGQLSAREVDELWAELIEDGYHLDYLKSAANLKAVIEQRRESKSSKDAKVWYYAAAAVIALLIAVLGVMNWSMPNGTEVQPVSSIELDYYRSGDGSLDAVNESGIIRDAIRLANTGRINEAISLLDEELKKASEPAWVAELSLNLGSFHYNEAKYNKAIDYYSSVITNKEHIDVLMLEKAYWYTGNAYFHIDKLAEARANIKEAYKLNGAYRRVAKSYLDALAE